MAVGGRSGDEDIMGKTATRAGGTITKLATGNDPFLAAIAATAPVHLFGVPFDGLERSQSTKALTRDIEIAGHCGSPRERQVK